MQVFKSDRSFVLSSYSHSHGLLLLRSNKTVDDPTRLDILFQDVRAMELRCWFQGLIVEEVGPEHIRNVRSGPEQIIEPGNRIYALRGDQWEGFIVGGIVRVAEDDSGPLDPSNLEA